MKKNSLPRPDSCLGDAFLVVASPVLVPVMRMREIEIRTIDMVRQNIA
ncbi:MAG: hypothetical protein WCC39_10510 [Telluria sp.]